MTIFSKIIKGEIPSYKIAEDQNFFAFLDISPMQKGHTLVVPKLAEPEEDYIFRLDDQLLADMMIFSKKVATAIQEYTECKRVGVAVLGMEVPHVHIHLVPLFKESDMNFSNPKLSLSPEEMAQIAQQIAEKVTLS